VREFSQLDFSFRVKNLKLCGLFNEVKRFEPVPVRVAKLTGGKSDREDVEAGAAGECG
jgi:hypothetical protein